jgi:basic membrane protein A and related proteins
MRRLPLAVLFAVVLVGCSGSGDGAGDAGGDAATTGGASGEPVPEGEAFAVGWVFEGPPDSEAVSAVEAAFPDRVESVVEEAAADPAAAASELAAQGARLVLSTVPGACAGIPDVHCVEPGGSGEPGASAVFLDEGWWNRAYLLGRAVGLTTQTDVVGYVPAPGSPEENGAVNAFALGCQSVNPNCVVQLPGAANPAKAVGQLGKQDADVFAASLGNPGCEAARGALAVQPVSALGDPCGSALLVADAATTFEPFVEAELEGTFEGGRRVALPLGEWTDGASAEVRTKVEERAAEIEGGLNVFAGPLFDNRGEQRVAEGEELTPEFVAGEWDWLLGGVFEPSS